MLARIVAALILAAATVAAQPCTTSAEWYYRSGVKCASGGYQGCRYSMGFAPYLPPGGGSFLMMATGYDLNVYRVAGDAAPTLVQQTALGFPYSAISKTFLKPSIDPATGYGFAPYLHSASEMPFPSRIFRADPATGRVAEVMKVGEDVAGGVGIRGCKVWGLSFSIGGVPFVAYHEATETDLVGGLKVYRLSPGPPATLSLAADLGANLRSAEVLRGADSVTIVGTTTTALVVIRLTLVGGVLQSTTTTVGPGRTGANRFDLVVADPDDRGVAFAGTYSAQRRAAGLEAWSVTGAQPAYLGGVEFPGVFSARPYAAGGGWVMATDAATGAPYLISAANPAGMVGVPYATGFPQANPPPHGSLALYGAAAVPIGGVTYLATAHMETAAWSRLSPACLGGIVPQPTQPPVVTPTPTQGPPAPTATPAPPGVCPPCPTCPPVWATATPVPQWTPTRTPYPTAPPAPTQGGAWYCHQGAACMPGEPNPFGGAGCPAGWEANHEPCR